MHRQTDRGGNCIQFDPNLPGIGVANRIIYGLLRDPVKMGCHGVVGDRHGPAAGQGAGALEGGLDLGGHVAEGGFEAFGAHFHRGHPARQLSRLQREE